VSQTPQDESRAGIIYAALAYTIWGIMPIYWRLLGDVPSFEITLQRVVWSAVFVAAITFVSGNFARVLAILRTPRTVGMLAITSLLISSNWAIYIYCVETNQLVEASLGYYMTPLVSFALGSVFFSEHISRLRLMCIFFASVALILQLWALGHFPWIAPALAVSFGIYGYLRKRAPVAALDGLFVELALLFPLALGFVVCWQVQGVSGFARGNVTRDLLLIGAGPTTAIPLLMFAAGARRVSMTTLGFLQYLAPSITLLMAVFGFHEAFTQIDLISFGCIWTALVIVALEGRFSRVRKA
jgi:chloramphenicol-sensitive protein RarD